MNLADFKKHLLSDRPVIDVRAAIEFAKGSIPGSVNLPILNDGERTEVGICYKKKGSDKAIELGHQIVSGENKRQKLQAWIEQIQKNPDTVITCYRGGQRSQITQQFLKSAGYEVSRLDKGYKEVRQFFIDQLKSYSQKSKMILISGTTGSAKTHLLKRAQTFYPGVDLENLARHRGSAFGLMTEPQPSQADFENQLCKAILKIENEDQRPIVYEDESRLIGRCHLTEEFFDRLRSSPVILVRQTLAERVENIFKDYIVEAQPNLQLFEKYEKALQRIQKRLGGVKTQEIFKDLQKSKLDFLNNDGFESNRIWIEKLLVHYYDILYRSSFEKRKPRILFEGRPEEILDFLSGFKQLGSE